jgi:UDP-N-acetylmuramate: L-alanyl-gamma-D-glutamyl-meso-diaminopimelate ligase
VREQHPGSRIIAAFEPRSNTMVRNIFQRELTTALSLADHAIIGTIHRLERIPEPDKLDLNRLVSDLTAAGTTARQMSNAAIGDYLLSLLDSAPSVIVFMSNASFDGIPRHFVETVSHNV